MQLNKKYNQKDFETFLVDFLPEDFVLAIKDIETEKKFNKIQKARVLGECQSLGLKVIELEHGQEKDPRIALAKEAFMLMADVWAKKALVVFKSSNSDNWRLSYMTISFNINDKNRVEKNISNPRRKSFFLGPDSKISTPDRYLLKKSRITTIEELEACFDVEVVTKEFFDNYKKLFDKLFIYLKEDETFNAFAVSNKIKIDDFAKKLLGQIVFIYFLQKKGWLGAKKEQHIYEGDANFLRNLFIKCDIEKKSYFNDVLERLFYDAFNKESERAGNFYREYFDCQIPFLNGGLFEPLNKYDWEKSFLHIPNELFSNSENSGILDIFDLYNFTIDENSLIDQEVSVDPEMLGKVFEKLLDTNKETGSFYTPREIVSYMVKQSLIEYLKTKTEIHADSIDDLVNNHRIGNAALQNKDFVVIENALREIRIIDPAVGSGAFPVGILQEITEIRLLCQSQISDKPKLAYDIKKEILENNVYGVDIDHGAIDIARLRFWLSLVVDADLNDVEPLPNLDFKLVAANSLLPLRGDEGFWDEKDLLSQMKELREKYFRARTKNGKEKIQNDFNKIVRKSNNLLATDRQKQIFTYNPFSSSTVANFFDSEFMFGIKEFDIVIGNPPYVNISNLEGKDRVMYKNIYLVNKNKIDLYAYFIEKGNSVLKTNGILSYIIPHTWKATTSFSKLRYLIFNNFEMKTIVNLDYGTFEATVKPVIIILKKHVVGNYKIKVLNDKFSEVNEINKEEINSGNDYSIDTSSSLNEKELFKKIETGSFPLGEICKFTRGIKTSNDKKFLNKNCANTEYKKVIRGRDIKKYFYIWNGEYIWYRPDLMKEKAGCLPHNKDLFEVPEKLILQRISKGLLGAIDYKGIYALDTCLVSNITTLDNKYSLKYLLALINSNLLNFWYSKKFTLPTVSGYELHQLPIKVDFRQKLIIDLMDQIIKNRDINPVFNIVDIEREINQIIYDVYGLNKEDIALVEK